MFNALDDVSGLCRRREKLPFRLIQDAAHKEEITVAVADVERAQGRGIAQGFAHETEVGQALIE